MVLPILFLHLSPYSTTSFISFRIPQHTFYFNKLSQIFVIISQTIAYSNGIIRHENLFMRSDTFLCSDKEKPVPQS